MSDWPYPDEQLAIAEDLVEVLRSRAERYRRRAFALRRALLYYRRGDARVNNLLDSFTLVIRHLSADNVQLNEQLSNVQARCTELLNEVRALRK